MDRKLLKANLEMILQGEDDYVLGLKGFKWDTTNGGVNPTTANVVTGSNWDVNVASNKDLAGVKIDVDQS
jgi:thiamine pyrophosphokinase